MLVSFPFSHYVYVAYGSIIGMRTADRTHQIVYGASSTYYRLIQNKNKVILIKPIKEDTYKTITRPINPNHYLSTDLIDFHTFMQACESLSNHCSDTVRSFIKLNSSTVSPLLWIIHRPHQEKLRLCKVRSSEVVNGYCTTRPPNHMPN